MIRARYTTEILGRFEGRPPIDSHQTPLMEDRQASATELNHDAFLFCLCALGENRPKDVLTYRKRFNKLSPLSETSMRKIMQ